jgi:hypothetical protein
LYRNYTAIFTELRQVSERETIEEGKRQSLKKRFEEMSEVIEGMMEGIDIYQELFGMVGLVWSGRGNGYRGYLDLVSWAGLGRERGVGHVKLDDVAVTSSWRIG